MSFRRRAIQLRLPNPESGTTRRAVTAVLDQALKERHADRHTEVWRVTKSNRELTCAAVHTRVGLNAHLD